MLKDLFMHLEPGGSLVIGIIAGKSPWSKMYEEAAKSTPDSVFSSARFWTEEKIQSWNIGGKLEIAKALFFPPTAGEEAERLEREEQGSAGFIVAKWVKE